MTPRPPPRSLAHAASGARSWRPVLPDAVIAAALRTTRDGVPALPGRGPRELDFSAAGIRRTRAAFERLQTVLDPAPPGLERETIQLASCRAQRLRLRGRPSRRVVLALHGGAYLTGSTTTHLGAMARLMAATDCEVLSVDYRLAPEHPFPAALDDALAAYRYLLETPAAPAQIAIGGSSTGGALTLSLLQRVAQLGLPQPACAFVISPWADLSGSGPSRRDNADRDVTFSPRVIRETAAFVARQAGLPLDDPLLSPAFGRYAGAPPLRIDVSAREALRSDSDLVAAAYRRDGGRAELHVHPAAPHGWPSIGAHRASRTTAREIAAFLDTHWSGAAD